MCVGGWWFFGGRGVARGFYGSLVVLAVVVVEHDHGEILKGYEVYLLHACMGGYGGCGVGYGGLHWKQCEYPLRLWL